MLTRVKKAFEKALFPDKCQACGVFFHCDKNPQPDGSFPDYFQQTSIELVFRREMSLFLCPECLTQFTPLAPPFCAQCGRMFAGRVSDNHHCEDCIKQKKPYHSARSAGLFSGALMETIHGFKYAGKLQLADPLGRILFAAFIQYFNEKMIDIIIPVPLHASRLRQRGFNQAMLLLRQWPQLAKAVMSADISIDLQGNILARNKKTKSQTGLGKKKRKSNIKGAFAVKDPLQVKGKRMLLVDDVYTTGATTEECAKTLMRRGADCVCVLTLARVE